MSDRQCRLALLAVALFFLGYALSSRVGRLSGYIFSDEATYLMMAQSVAHDGDLRYTRGDLERVYAEYFEGPQGLYLKKGHRSRLAFGPRFPFVQIESKPSKALYYAKSYMQPLVAAPFVLLFGDNGFALMHSVLLGLMLFAGYAYVRRFNPAERSLLYAATFMIAGVTVVYLFWMNADYFNVAAVFFGYFFWLYKHAPHTERTWLDSAWTDYLAAAILAMATFSKINNGLLIVPLVLHEWLGRRFLRGVAVGAAFGLALCLLFGVNFWITGDLFYQSGDRKIFYFHYPLMDQESTFEKLGIPMSTTGMTFLFSWRVVAGNLFYFFFGRFAGAFIYFPATLAALFVLRKTARSRQQWMVLGVIVAEILLFMLMTPFDYQGGGAGSLGNRYFLTIAPLFFFLVTTIPSPRPLFWCWIFTGIFLSQILLNPYRSSFEPGLHASKYPFKWLSPEMALLYSLPCNQSRRASQVPFGGDPPLYKLYWLDEHFYGKESNIYEGFWTQGEEEAEVILQSPKPLSKIIVRLVGGPLITEATVKQGFFDRQTVPLQASEARATFDVGGGFPFPGPSYLYRLRIRAHQGFTPAFHNPESSDTRYLGCFVGFDVVPR
ncbi:MAG: hypothetical protein AB1714_00055 [Acidobacteriota bacterium]